MSAWEGLNRRKFPRVSFPCLVTVQSQEEKDSILTHTENLGIGGVCVVLKKALKMFSPVVLELDLLDGSEHIQCKGKVVWSIRRKGDEEIKPFFYDIGVEFTDIDKNDVKRIEETIQYLVRKTPKSFT